MMTASQEYEEIDIYLFSNGQQYSPPRKYHLRKDDFQWWDATLCTLARSQYGSLHSSIQLYTLDGKKVQSPSELKDNFSYVAVVPPDSFVDAGYDKYLMKASRSWEKRQSKRTGIEDCKPDGAEKDVQTLDQNITLDNVVLLNRVSDVPLQTTESSQRHTSIHKSLIKPVSPRLAEKNKPGAKQVSQYPVSRKSNSMPAPVEPTTKKVVSNKREPAKNNVRVSRQNTPGRSSAVNSGGFAGKNKSSSLPIYNVPHKVDDRNMLAFKGRGNRNVSKIDDAINKIKLPIRKKSDQGNLFKKIEERSKIQTPVSKRTSTPIKDELNTIKTKGITNIKKSFTITQTPLPKKYTSTEGTTMATEKISSILKDLEEMKVLETTPVTKSNDADINTAVGETKKVPILNDTILASSKNAANNETLNMLDQLLLSKPTSNYHDKPRPVDNTSAVDLLPHTDSNSSYRSPPKPVRNDKVEYDLIPFTAKDEYQTHDSSTNPTVNDNKNKLPSKPTFSENEDDVFLHKPVSKSKIYDPLPYTPNELICNVTGCNDKDYRDHNLPPKLTNSPNAVVNDNKPFKLLSGNIENIKNYDSPHKTENYDLLPNTTVNNIKYNKMPSEPEGNAKKVKNTNLLPNPNGNDINQIEISSLHEKIGSKNSNALSNSPVLSSKNDGSPFSVIPPSKNIDFDLPRNETYEKAELTDSGKEELVKSNNEKIHLKTWTLENINQAKYDPNLNINNNNSSLKKDAVVNDATAGSQQIVTLVINKNYIITKPENENDTKHTLETFYTPTNASHNVVHIEKTKKTEIYESDETSTFKNAVQDKKDETNDSSLYKNSESEAMSSYVDAEDTQDKRSTTRRRGPVKMFDIDSSNDFVDNKHSLKVKEGLTKDSKAFNDYQNSNMAFTDGLKEPLLQSRTQSVPLQSTVTKNDIIEPVKILDSPHDLGDDKRSLKVKEELSQDLEALNINQTPNRVSTDGLKVQLPIQLQSSVIKNDIVEPVKIFGIDSSNNFNSDVLSSKVKEGLIKDLKAFNGYQNPNMVSTDGLKVSLPQSRTPLVPSQSIVVKNGIIEGDTDQFIAIVQNGDVINLKLNIEIKKSTGIFKNIQTVDTRKSRFSNNSKKDESNNDDGLTQNKSLQSVDSECPPHLCCRKGQQMIIQQCPCCNQCASRDTPFRMITRPVNDDMQPYYVLLPVMKQEDIKCLKPCQESCKTCEKQSQNTESLTKINTISSVRETFTTVAVDETIDPKEYSSKHVAIVSEENIRTEVVTASASQTSRRVIETTHNFAQADSHIQEITTQTDWCDVLLEARLHPDGHYTFHLPSIEMLRQHNLLQNQ